MYDHRIVQLNDQLVVHLPEQIEGLSRTPPVMKADRNESLHGVPLIPASRIAPIDVPVAGARNCTSRADELCSSYILRVIGNDGVGQGDGTIP